jgi:hypothetical protein
VSIKSEGGRAFPSNYVEQEGPNKGMQMVAGGMTRRQWLAGMAMQAEMSNPADGEWAKEYFPKLAALCYAVADAMLAFETEVRK